MSGASVHTASWSRLNIVQKLIVVNVAVFLLVNILKAVFGLFMISLQEVFDLSRWLAVPAYPQTFLTRPWTLITYMFFHEGFWHILFNMMWLFWMGNIFLEYLGPKKLFSTYLLGGISGALLYMVAFNLFPLFRPVVSASYALGASAAVLAITVGIATLLPDYTIRLFLIGNIPLKFLAGATLLLDVLSISGSNAGGHIAHLGGALFGFIYVRRLKQGQDLAAGLNRFLDKLVSRAPRRKKRWKKPSRQGRPLTDEDYLGHKLQRQERIDEILEKISRSGYGSLSQEEKDILFRSSKDQ
jgi:membrane associated rhomboid family serine protease